MTIRYKAFTLFLLVMYCMPVSMILAGKKLVLNGNGIFAFMGSKYYVGRVLITSGSNAKYVGTNSLPITK